MSNTPSLLARLYERSPAFQYRNYRLFWIGRMISIMGSQMQLIAVDWHVYRLLQNNSYTLSLFGQSVDLDAAALGLGSLGLVRILPVIIFSLLGGIIADMYDRRWILVGTSAMSGLCALALALVTLGGNESLFAIYFLTAAMAGATAFDQPARQSLVPNLVSRDHFTNAISLDTVTWKVGSITGPAIAGILVASFNTGVVYALNAVSFVAVIIALLLMRYQGHAASTHTKVSWAALVEGWRFVYGTPLIWSTMLLDFFATFFGAARTMLPIIADEILGVGAVGFGILATAQSAGSLLAGLVASFRDQIHNQGTVLLASVALYGAATALFGLSTAFSLSYLFFALTGAADTISMIIRSTLRQLMTPDRLRGRMVSVNMIFFMGGPQLGELEAGIVAALFGAPFAIVTGGLATVGLTAWVAWRYPHLRNYKSDTPLPTVS